MNTAIMDLVKFEKTSALSSVIISMQGDAKRLEVINRIDSEYISDCLESCRDEIDIPENVNPYVYINTSGVELTFDIKSIKYEELIEFNDASLSWNGNWITSTQTFKFGEVAIVINYEAKVPSDVKDTLMACEKLVEEVETNVRVAC